MYTISFVFEHFRLYDTYYLITTYVIKYLLAKLVIHSKVKPSKSAKNIECTQ